VYDPRPSTPGLLPLMPEWYLLIAVFVVLTLYDLFHNPLLFRVPGLSISISPLLLASAGCALLVQAFRAGWASTRDCPSPQRSRAALASLTSGLFVLQPLARLSGRVRHGLTPWRRRGALRIGVPWSRRHVVWSESWRSARDRLLAIEAHLRPNCMSVVRGGEYDRWDIRARLGPLATAQLGMTIEEHGSGRQLARFRVWPRWSPGLGALLVLLVGAAVARLLTDDSLSATVLGVSALVLGVRGLQECGASVAAIIDAVEAVVADAAAHDDAHALLGALDRDAAPTEPLAETEGDGVREDDELDRQLVGPPLVLGSARADG
jgi:hypothetical protein